MKALAMGIALLMLAGTTGCQSIQHADTPTRFSRDHLTHEQIQASGLATAYDLVHAQRNNWLRERHRPLRQNEAVAVYLDGVYFGGPQTLQAFSTGDVLALRRVRPEDTIRLLGRYHPNGAIHVARYQNTLSQER
jgi:hypothetical protein